MALLAISPLLQMVLIVTAMLAAAIAYGWFTRPNRPSQEKQLTQSPPQEKSTVPFWRPKPTLAEYRFGGTAFSLVACAAITLFAFQLSEPPTSYRWILSLAIATVSTLIALTCLIGYKNSSIANTQDVAIHESTRPAPPPPKSKRPTAKEKVSQASWQRFGPATIAFFATFIGLPFFQSGALWFWGTVIPTILALFITAWWNSLDFVREGHREIEREQQEKFRQEDEAWANYEREVKLWEERQQYQAGMQTDQYGISEIARKIVAERQRGNS